MSDQDSTLGPPDAVVRIVEGTDLTGSTGLTSAECFVLSRVDGTSSLQTICLLTGLGEEQTLAILSALHDRGLIETGGEEPHAALEQPRAASAADPQSQTGAAGPRPHVAPSAPPAREPAEAQERQRPAAAAQGDATAPEGSEGGDQGPGTAVEEEVDLKPEVCSRIRDMASRVGELTLFELFDVPPEADIKAIRKAFFAQSKIFHPDRYFGKKLGPYGDMLHNIFKQMNAGYKMLCDKDKLAEYRQMVVHQLEQEQLAQQVEQQADCAEEEPPPRELRAASESGRAGSESAVRNRSRSSGAFRDHRVKALMDLVGHRRSNEAPAAQQVTARDEVPERRLRRESQIGVRVDRGAGSQFSRARKARQFFAQGKAQLEQGQYLAATASLRLATTYSPDDREYAAAYAQASAKARGLSADNYFKRGMMEEAAGRYEAAAGFFIKAGENSEDGAHLAKAAEATLWRYQSGKRDSHDLAKASDYANRAVQADPGSIDIRIIAAKVYKAAGMKRNAHRELQQALKIEPNNVEAKELLEGI